MLRCVGGRRHSGRQLNHSREIGINSVPTFVLNSRYGIPGMVPKETLVAVFREQLAKVA